MKLSEDKKNISFKVNKCRYLNKFWNQVEMITCPIAVLLSLKYFGLTDKTGWNFVQLKKGPEEIYFLRPSQP